MKFFWFYFWEFGIGSANNPLIDTFLGSHQLCSWFCIDIVRRISLLVTHGNCRIEKEKKGKTDHDSKICLLKNDPLYNYMKKWNSVFQSRFRTWQENTNGLTIEYLRWYKFSWSNHIPLNIPEAREKCPVKAWSCTSPSLQIYQVVNLV